MEKSKQKIVNLTSIFVLLILAVLFIHSELGLTNVQEEAHNQHDFCDLVKNTMNAKSHSIESITINFSYMSYLIATPHLQLFDNSSNLVFIAPFKQFLTTSSRLSFLNTLLI